MIALLLAVQAVSPAPVMPSAPVAPSLVEFRAGPVRCDGQEIAVAAPIRPIPTIAAIPVGRSVAPFVMEFTITAEGRTLSIRPAAREVAWPFVNADDLQPALAAARFAPGAARGNCSIRFEVEATPVDAAPIALLHRYAALPHARGYGDEAIDRRIREASPACFTARPPAVLLQGFPDFDRIAQPAGALSMTMVGYDIDRRGRPVRVRTETSDGNAALDWAGRQAIARSRYAAGTPRTGCTYPFHRRQAQPLVPPAMPEGATFRGDTASCDRQVGGWTLPPRLTFPEPFRRRAIEGIAIVRYDVAPWGETGNVTVLASEPAAAFGMEAQRIITQARRAPSATGASGCVERVVFKLPESMAPAAPAAD